MKTIEGLPHTLSQEEAERMIARIIENLKADALHASLGGSIRADADLVTVAVKDRRLHLRCTISTYDETGTSCTFLGKGGVDLEVQASGRFVDWNLSRSAAEFIK